MKISGSSEITSIKLVNIKTDEELSLFERERSRCHFLEEFGYKNYFIQLRLDWGDLNNQGDPKMDADIWLISEGNKKFLRKDKWHHTEKQYDTETNRRIYIFEFEDLKLYLGTKQTVEKTMGLEYCIKQNFKN